MTEQTNKGVLTDKEGAGFPGCRILVDGEQTDRPFTVLNFVQRYLDAIPKKARVCFQTKDGKISKVWEDKPEPAAEEKPAANPPKPSNSGELKVVEGQIVAIDHAAHKITVKDREGVQHSMVWPPQLNDQMGKLKQWWFTRITGELQADVDIWKLTAQGYFKKPEDWPVSAHGGKGGYQPRNEKLIAFLALHRDMVSLFQTTTAPDTQDFEQAAALIYATAKEAADKAMKDFPGGA